MEHTKGPWKTHPYFEVVTGPNGEFICMTVKPGMTPKAHTEANCKLIAAAPDLLSALEDTIGSLELETDLYGFNRHQETIDKAKAVLTKAKLR